MAILKLSIGNTVLADSATDGVTRWMRSENSELHLRAESKELVGRRYARNTSRSWGLSLALSIIVGRQFASYVAAEDYVIRHMAALSAGLEGRLKYQSYLGTVSVFDNAALESVSVESSIGISTEIKYSFKCGAPLSLIETAIIIGGFALSINDQIVTVKDYGKL